MMAADDGGWWWRHCLGSRKSLTVDDGDIDGDVETMTVVAGGNVNDGNLNDDNGELTMVVTMLTVSNWAEHGDWWTIDGD